MPYAFKTDVIMDGIP